MLAPELRRALAPRPTGFPIWAVGMPLLLCCWPVGAVMVAVWAPFRWRWRLALIFMSLLLLVAVWGSYVQTMCTSTVDSHGTGGVQCGSGTSPSPIPGRSPASSPR